jgi:hypothetical protein
MAAALTRCIHGDVMHGHPPAFFSLSSQTIASIASPRRGFFAAGLVSGSLLRDRLHDRAHDRAHDCSRDCVHDCLHGCLYGCLHGCSRDCTFSTPADLLAEAPWP